MSQRILVSVALIVLAIMPISCATKGTVKREVARIDQEMTGLQTSVENNETRLKEQDAKLASHDQSIAQLSTESKEALDRAQSAERLAQGKLLYEVTLSDDSVKFPTGAAKLSPEMRTALDNLINQLKADNKNVFIEIQGYTDSVGSKDYNYKLGMERAEAVRRYLAEAGIPLHRISTISYGEDRSVAPNNTRAGRSKNRRVVIQVLA